MQLAKGDGMILPEKCNEIRISSSKLIQLNNKHKNFKEFIKKNHIKTGDVKSIIFKKARHQKYRLSDHKRRAYSSIITKILNRSYEDNELLTQRWNKRELHYCFSTRTDKVLKKDLKTGIEIKDIIIEQGYRCLTDNCEYEHLYSQKCHWKRHALTTHCHRIFECNLCTIRVTFKQQSQLREHISNKHSVTRTVWLCPYGCNGIFSQFRGVVRHVKLDRKCRAREEYFTKIFITKLKDNWDNTSMKLTLKRIFHIENDKDKIDFIHHKLISKEIQKNIRNGTKTTFNHYEQK